MAPEIHTQDELVERIEEELRIMPGQTLSFSQPIEQRVNEMISGVRSDVAVKIFGDDFGTLEAAGEQVRKILGAIDGATRRHPARAGSRAAGPAVRVRQEQLARYGIPARAVLDLVESLAGKPLGEVIEGQIPFPLALRLPERYRSSPEAVGSLLVTTASGERVPLSRLARSMSWKGRRRSPVNGASGG